LAVAIYAALMFSLGAFCHPILDPELPADQVLALLKDVDKVIPLVVMKLAPPGVKRVDTSSRRAASMSTLAVTFVALSAAFVRDIIQSVKPSVEGVKLVAIARIAPAIFALIALALAANPVGIIVEMVGAAFAPSSPASLGQ